MKCNPAGYPENKMSVAEWEAAKKQAEREHNSRHSLGGLVTMNLDELDKMEMNHLRPTVVVLDQSKPKSFDLQVDNTAWWYEDSVSDYKTSLGMALSLLHLLDKDWFTREHVRQLLTLFVEDWHAKKAKSVGKPE